MSVIFNSSKQSTFDSNILERNQIKEFSTEPEIESSGPFIGLPRPFQKKDYTSGFPYVGCNELEQERTLQYLQEHPSLVSSNSRVQLGFSVWFNFVSSCCNRASICCLL
jgi:hypothetical protein